MILVLQKMDAQESFVTEKTIASKDSFWVDSKNFSALPKVFQQGFVMLYSREEPGGIYVLTTKGAEVWSIHSANTGFKVVRYTKNKTFLCITGTKEQDAGFGNTILELSLHGDTLLYLKKGEADFRQAIHHEILVNAKNQLVTLTREEKIIDLSSRGGLKNDTVIGDGIQVLDRNGKQVWKWSVFDKVDPLSDINILKTKKDWTHANCIAIDKDGHYLVSFYSTGQIWKINATTGNVLWKFGKNGDFKIPDYAVFAQAHGLHINDKGWLMFFDNGADKRISRTLAFQLNKTSKTAEARINTWLPPPMFSDRMGSSYLVADTTLLVCIARHKTIALTNFNGNFLWQLQSNRIHSYRAEFIPKETLQPYLPKLTYTATK